MGGCCCCFPKHGEWNDQSRLHHFPVVSEESQPLSSRSGAASIIPTGLLLDANATGNPQSPLNNRERAADKRDVPVQTNNSEPVGEMKSDNNGENGAKESNYKEQTNNEQVVTEFEAALQKSGAPFVRPEECPTCLEEYDEENPKILTKCDHHFHLSCILEWMERSDTCPVCAQEMVLDFPIDD